MALEYEIKANGVGFDALERELKGFAGTADEFAKKLRSLGVELAKGGQGDYVIKYKTSGAYRALEELRRALQGNAKAEAKREAELSRAMKTEQGSLMQRRQMLSQAKQDLTFMARGSTAYKTLSGKVEEYTTALRRANGVMPNSQDDIAAIGKSLQEQASKLTLAEQKNRGLTKAIEQNAAALSRAKGVQQGSIADLQRLQANAAKLASTLPAGTKAQKEAAMAVEVYNKKIQKASGKTTNFISVLGKLSTIQSGILAITSAFSGVTGAINQVVNRTKSIESFNLALKNVGLSAVETAATFNVASESAFKLGAPVEQVEKAFKRIVPVLRAIGTTSQDTNKFIESLTARTQVLGLTTEASGRLQEAFAQVLSKGKLQAEELTQQISEVDGAFRTQFADALGVTVGQLQELVKNGEITSEVFVKTFLKMQNGAELLSAKVENGTATIQQLQNNLGNIQTKTLEALGASMEPAIRNLLALSNEFAKFVQAAIQSSFGQALINAFNSIVATIKVLGTAFLNAARFVGGLLAPLGPLLEIISNLAGPIAAVVAAVVSWRIATGLFTAIQLKMNLAIMAGGKAAALFKGSVIALKTALKALAAGNAPAFLASLQASLVNLSKGSFASIIGDLPLGFSKIGKSAGKAKGKVVGFGKTIESGLRLADEPIKNTGKSLVKLGTKAAPAKAAFAALGVAAKVGFGVVGAAVVAGVVVFNGYSKTLKELNGPIKESQGSLNKLGFEVGKTAGSFNIFKKALEAAAGPIVMGSIKIFQRIGEELTRLGQRAAINDSLRTLNTQLSSVSETLRNKGVKSFLDLGNASNLSSQQLNKTVAGLRAIGTGAQGSAAALQKQLDAQDQSTASGKRQAEFLKVQIDRFLEKAAATEIAARGLSTVTGKNVEAAASDQSLNSTIAQTNKALAERAAMLDSIATKINTEGQDKLNQGLITEKQLALTNAAVANQIAEKKLADIQAQITANAALRAQSNQDVIALQDQALKLRDTQVQANEQVKQSEAALKAAQIARIQEVKTENDNLISSYGQLKGIQNAAISDLGTNISSSLENFLSAVKQAAKINFKVTGDKQFLTEALRVEGEVFQMNANIEQIKRTVAQAEKIHKLEMISLEAQAQRAMLEAQGIAASDPRIGVLDQVIDKTNTVKGINEAMHAVNERAINFELSQQQAAINVRRVAAGLPPLKVFDTVSVKEMTNFVKGEVPKLKSSFEKLAGDSKNLNREVEGLAKQGITNIKDATREGEGAIEKISGKVQEETTKLKTEADKLKTNLFGFDPEKVSAALGETKGQFQQATKQIGTDVTNMNTKFQESSSAIKQLGSDSTTAFGEVSKAVSAVSALQERMQGLPTINRAMGGPVAGGQTYKVNDGGGRESFVDNTGKVTLLPAARNMKWTAPKSGYVLNADDTKAMINNNKINASITAATKSARPVKSSQSVSGIVSPGTLMKQMGSIMKGGDTQRITNNVTIQSQSPVMDASKLLTDINIMRARRGRRL